VSSEILPDGDEVDIRIQVEEGEPVRVRGLQVQGLDPLPRALRQTMRSRVQLKRGQPFDEGLYDQTKQRLLRTLRNEGYARAGVSGQVTVATDVHQADVTLVVRPGPVCRLRGIHIRGLVDVRASRVRVALGMRRGDKFSDRAMESAQAALFGLGVFQSVQVRPEVDPDEPYVDVIVEVAEAGFGRFRAGGGVSADRDRTSFHLTGAWEHRNMFGGLQRLTITHRPGLSISPGIFDAETLGFDNGLTVDFSWPGFPERETTFLHHGAYNAGLDTAANLCRHDVRLTTGVSRGLTKWLRATVSHEMQLFVPVNGGTLFFNCEPLVPLPATYEKAFLSYLSETLVVIRSIHAAASTPPSRSRRRPRASGRISGSSLSSAMRARTFSRFRGSGSRAGSCSAARSRSRPIARCHRPCASSGAAPPTSVATTRARSGTTSIAPSLRRSRTTRRSIVSP
jgi:hypothetical protein